MFDRVLPVGVDIFPLEKHSHHTLVSLLAASKGGAQPWQYPESGLTSFRASSSSTTPVNSIPAAKMSGVWSA